MGDNFVVEAELYLGDHRMNVEKVVRSVRHPKEGENIQLLRLEERSEEEKQKYRKMTHENRFKRNPSPTRKEIQ